MTKFATLLTITLISAPLTSCNTFQVHPFELGVTLPYSEKCHFKNVLTKEVHEYEPAECERIKKRSLILTSDAWRVIKTDIKNNCSYNQCVQLSSKVDEIFLALDQALEIIP